MQTAGVLLRKELTESWRTNRWLVVAVVAVLFGLMSPVLARYLREIIQLAAGDQVAGIPMPEPTIGAALAQYLKNVSQIVFLLGILVSMGAIVAERERGTAAMVLSKPVARGTFLLAKYAGLLIVVGTAMALGAVAAYYYTLVLFSAPPVGAYLGLNALLFVYLALLMAITLLASTLVRSQAAAGAVGFAAFVLLSLFGALPGAGEYLPPALITWAGHLAIGDTAYTAWGALLVTLAGIAACLGAAWLVFRRQEV
jgi:ABC-2 type transport system permease protein